ncbi:hypothetical protein [Providencia hangzhouensis]|uniref:hypothetical protein n=1 Tax=Providencia hangzhouensis TaxID=3031799 RepID=UPI0034DD4FB5
MNLNPMFSPLKAKFVLFSAALSFSTLLAGCGENASFITQCKLQGGSRAMCECSWDKMAEKYPTKYLVAIGEGKAMPPADFTQQMRNAFIQCSQQ